MTRQAAAYILKNAAWIGSVGDFLELQEAIETLADTPTWIEGKALPDPDVIVPITVSGEAGNVTYDHALMLGTYFPGDGWFIEGLDPDEQNKITVHAWCELEPYEQS